MQLSTTIKWTAVGLLLGVGLVMAQMRISQYPNITEMQGTDLFVIATGMTNKNVSWAQLVARFANVTNTTITNLTVYEGLISNLYGTNFYVEAFEATEATISTNLNLLEGANTTYTVATNNTTTNVVVSLTNAVQTIRLTNSITLFSTTNRPAGTTNLAMTLVVFYNSSGGNLTVNTNNTLGWKVDGTAFPLTVTNGDCQTLTFTSWGPYETNVLVGSKWFH